MSEIVPFGKYKGQPVEALAADKGYSDWLTAQPWFRERYAGIYTLIVNNFTEPSETPEHNRLQARFLDDEFCFALLRIVGPDWIKGDLRPLLTKRIEQAGADERSAVAKFYACTNALHNDAEEFIREHEPEPKYDWLQHRLDESKQTLDQIVEWWARNARHRRWQTLLASLPREKWSRHSYYSQPAEHLEQRLADAETALAEVSAELVNYDRNWPAKLEPLDFNIQFESGGWDVIVGIGIPHPSPQHYEGSVPVFRALAHVEIKPVLADDFPAVLRQIKGRCRDSVRDAVLVIERFQAAEVTLEQVRRIFGFPIVTIAEIEAAKV